MIVLPDDTLAGVALLPDNIAEDASFLFVVVVPAVVHFFAHTPRHDWQGDQLRMWMLYRGSRSFTVVLENQHIAETLVILQVQHPVTVGPKDIFNSLLGQLRQRGLVLRRLDDDFMRADAVHLVEQAFSFAVEFPFDSQRGKAIRHHAN